MNMSGIAVKMGRNKVLRLMGGCISLSSEINTPYFRNPIIPSPVTAYAFMFVT
jgi:hypothetical protein